MLYQLYGPPEPPYGLSSGWWDKAPGHVGYVVRTEKHPGLTSGKGWLREHTFGSTSTTTLKTITQKQKRKGLLNASLKKKYGNKG